MLTLQSKIRFLALAAGATIALAGCSSINDLLTQEQVDYKVPFVVTLKLTT